MQPGLIRTTFPTSAGRQSRLKILSLSSVFPNPSDPGLGLFVRERLQHLSAWADVLVVAPLGLIDYSNPRGTWLRSAAVPRRRRDEAIEIWHPKWLYPPMSTIANPYCLAAQLFWPLRRLRAEFCFDLIDAHFGHPEGIAASLLASALNVPFTVTLRGNETRDAQRPSIHRAMARAFRSAARVIAVSRNLGELAVNMGVVPERVVVIPNGIDGRIFHPRDRIEVRVKHGISPHARVVLSAGSLIERKGHHRVIQALQSIGGGSIDAELLIAGSAGREGRYEKQIQRQAAELGIAKQIRFLGQVPPETLAELMCAADVLCLASTREGWPNVVHEATACGTPVVATRVGAMADMLPSGEYGIVVPPNDQAALDEALRNALEKPWQRDRIAAWGGSRNWEQVAAEVFRQFKQIMEGPRDTAGHS